jgi:hypothetical protein
MYNFRWCCGWRVAAAAEAEPLLDSDAAFEAVSDAIHTVSVKRKYLHYQMLKLEADANKCRHREEARAKLVLRQKIQKQYELLLGFYGNLCDVRIQLENAATIGHVAVTMELANSMMAAAASKLGAVDHVEDIMFDLREHRLNIDPTTATTRICCVNWRLPTTTTTLVCPMPRSQPCRRI